MKKLFYILIIALASSAAITACAEEDVMPASKVSNGGGSGSLDPL